MRIGLHTSIAKSLEGAALRAAEADLSAANDDDSRLMAQSAIEALKQLQGAKTPA